MFSICSIPYLYIHIIVTVYRIHYDNFTNYLCYKPIIESSYSSLYFRRYILIIRSRINLPINSKAVVRAQLQLQDILLFCISL